MTERTFPITLDDQIRSIPWDLIAPHDAQARANHSGKGLEQLAARGGVTVPEALAIIQNRPWERLPETPARRLLHQMVQSWGRIGTPPMVDALARLDKALDLAHRIRSVSMVKHTSNELIATLEGLRLLLEGRS